jgi:tetratricopeptide (TPR) repeat protein
VITVRWIIAGALASVLAGVAQAAEAADVRPQVATPTPGAKQGNLLEYRPEEQGDVLAPESEQEVERLEREETKTKTKTGRVGRAWGGEQQLWQLLRRRRYGELARRIREHRKVDPKWKPPARLLQLAHEGAVRAEVQGAMRGERWQRIVELAAKNPRQFTCRQVDLRWALAEAYHRSNDDERAREAYVATFVECPKSKDRQATLGKTLDALGPDGAARAAEEALARAKDDAAKEALRSFSYQLATRRIAEAFNAKRYPDASRLAAEITPQVRQRSDQKTALLLGWNEYQQEHFDEAAAWFRTVLEWNPKERSAVDGLVLAETKLGKTGEARAHAESYLGEPAAHEMPVLGDALFARALDLYHAGRFREALPALEDAERYRGKRRDSRLLHAWSHFQLGETDAAGEEFEALYREEHDAESAQGIAAVHLRLHKERELEERAGADGGALADAWSEYEARRYYDRKLFHLALPTAQGKFPELENVDSLSLTAGAMLRFKSGREGLDQLRVEKLPYAKAEFFRHGNGFFARADRVELDSDDPPPNAPIGSFPVLPAPYSARPTARLNNAVEPSVGFLHEAGWTPYIELGSTPIEGEVSPLPVGKAGFTKHEPRYFWGLEGFARPVRESILSYTGIRDPYARDKEFGRVVKVGGQLTLYRRLSENWGTSGQVTGAYLTGHEVEDNTQIAAGVSVTRDFTLRGFDYVAVGPQVSYEHYEKNLSQFTLGHGGYFSPDYLIQPVGSLNFLTREGRPFITKGDIGLGFQNHHQEASPFFPLAPDGRFYRAATESGFVFYGELLGVGRISAHWQAGFGGAARRTADFHDESGLVFVRYLFQPRPAVFSSDFEYFHSIY